VRAVITIAEKFRAPSAVVILKLPAPSMKYQLKARLATPDVKTESSQSPRVATATISSRSAIDIIARFE
jgi:hypothetical protein